MGPGDVIAAGRGCSVFEGGMVKFFGEQWVGHVSGMDMDVPALIRSLYVLTVSAGEFAKQLSQRRCIWHYLAFPRPAAATYN